MYERVIEDGFHYGATHNLALILSDGSEEIERDIVQALLLYEREIEEGSHYNAMFGLANVLR